MHPRLHSLKSPGEAIDLSVPSVLDEAAIALSSDSPSSSPPPLAQDLSYLSLGGAELSPALLSPPLSDTADPIPASPSLEALLGDRFASYADMINEERLDQLTGSPVGAGGSGHGLETLLGS